MSLRVVLTTTPGVGHVHPLVPIARELVDRGHEVMWVAPPGAAERVSGYGFPFTSGGVSIPERAQRFFASDPPLAGRSPRELRPIFFNGFFAEIGAPAMRDVLASVVDEFRPHVVVHDFCELAAAPVARARGIPHVTVAFSGWPAPAVLEAALPAMARVWASEGLDVPADLGCFDHLYLHPWPGSFAPPPRAATARESRHMGFDGAGTATDPPPWIAALGRDRPCVYVSFGTEVGPMAPWSAVLEACSELDADVVATTGQGLDLTPHGPVPPNVRVEQYVPQRFVLDRAALQVSHAGAGAIATGLELGLPQLCVPIAADQWDNADACVDAGVGLLLETDARSAEVMAGAMTALLSDSGVAASCRQVREDIAGMDGVSTTVDTIVGLAQG